MLRGHEDDLGGHHLVLKISKETWSGIKYMRVDKAPLVAVNPVPDNGEVDPAVNIYNRGVESLATTWGNLDGWLYNLAGNMRAEQTSMRVDALHPQQQLVPIGSNKWSCPLRRMSFWSKVTESFSPLLPSPGRTAKLFGEASGRNMIHGTRSHPTQLFVSLYSKLANVMTSNGFCYCVNWRDCQVCVCVCVCV